MLMRKEGLKITPKLLIDALFGYLGQAVRFHHLGCRRVGGASCNHEYLSHKIRPKLLHFGKEMFS
jgi:hypothetical protein